MLKAVRLQGFWPLDPGFGSADGRSGRPAANGWAEDQTAASRRLHPQVERRPQNGRSTHRDEPDVVLKAARRNEEPLALLVRHERIGVAVEQ